MSAARIKRIILVELLFNPYFMAFGIIFLYHLVISLLLLVLAKGKRVGVLYFVQWLN